MPPGITVVGLGTGDPGTITKRAWQVLNDAKQIHLRTRQHPAVDHLPPSLEVHAFDSLYEELPDFEAIYQAIVERLIELAQRQQGVVYGVPGDPWVGEGTVHQLSQQAAELGLPFEVVHGVSFVQPCLALMGKDALDGLVIEDALTLASKHHPAFSPDAPVLIGQLHSKMVASDVKLVLMNQYPGEHEVCLFHAAGTADAELEALPLFEIDRSRRIGDLTALYVPPLAVPSSFESFQETVAHLRAPEGCPWDKEQTHRSLRPHLLEEAFETLQALDEDDMGKLREELGDLLLQIVLHAQIATEAGTFTMAEAIASINDKIIRRHPHVFGSLNVQDVDQVLHNWEALKEGERDSEEHGGGLMEGVPKTLPALAQAWELQSRAARVGFDWPEVEGVIEKIAEEIQEIRGAQDPRAQESEVGDLLFALANYARWLGVDPESALREANTRFRRRFASIEAEAQKAGRALSEMSLKELEALWQIAKGEEG
ncbi:MAG: nucleoside triphosphate pyrophosphohydrolase [Anaerolineales bacterium]